MGQEHEPETVWRAQELYCSDRLSFVRVAEITGVADSTLRRWADIYEWREKREGIARAEADIRADKVLARAKTIKTLLDNPRADLAFAVSALEAQALKEAEAARQLNETSGVEAQMSVSIKTPADAIAALYQVVERDLSRLLTRREGLKLKDIQEVQKCFALISQLQSTQPEAENTSAGMSADLTARIEAAMRGEL